LYPVIAIGLIVALWQATTEALRPLHHIIVMMLFSRFPAFCWPSLRRVSRPGLFNSFALSLGDGSATPPRSRSSPAVREREFVEAARALGANDGRILLRHIPNIIQPVIVQSAIALRGDSSEGTMSFLG